MGVVSVEFGAQLRAAGGAWVIEGEGRAVVTQVGGPGRQVVGGMVLDPPRVTLLHKYAINNGC